MQFNRRKVGESKVCTLYTNHGNKLNTCHPLIPTISTLTLEKVMVGAYDVLACPLQYLTKPL